MLVGAHPLPGGSGSAAGGGELYLLMMSEKRSVGHVKIELNKLYHGISTRQLLISDTLDIMAWDDMV